MSHTAKTAGEKWQRDDDDNSARMTDRRQSQLKTKTTASAKRPKIHPIDLASRRIRRDRMPAVTF
jgi:hypothetical protein